MKSFKLAVVSALLCMASIAVPASAADYVVDTKGMHAFIHFRVKHLGYSWLYGRFNEFSGEFTYDPEQPKKNSIAITIDTTSLDTNHAERDKHIRGSEFLDVEEYPKAKFVSTSYKATGEDTGELTGDLTLHGQTHPVTIDVKHIGGGKDPWGGYRDGFEGTATIEPADWGIPMAKRLGPASAKVDLILSVEGVRQ